MGISYSYAVEDFYKARRRAALEEILGRISGRPVDLLSYEDIRNRIGGLETGGERLKEIPLDAIIGSVNRYNDFTRDFLPRATISKDRWMGVRQGLDKMEGLPPIEVYQIDEVYFVRDGHHRVSVARQTGATQIEAYVIKVSSPVPFKPGDNPDEVILRAEREEFQRQTKINELLPDADVRVSVPGQYPKLMEHISVHRYFMGIDQKREIAYAEAVLHWYEKYYLPVVNIIRARHLLRDFPGRTEADLYLWLTSHQEELGQELGWDVSATAAASDLAERYSKRIQNFLHRLGKRIYDRLTPDSLEASPPPGDWRREHEIGFQSEGLFNHILVAVSGSQAGWSAVDYAIEIARREGGWLNGLHVCKRSDEACADKSLKLRAEFLLRGSNAGVRSLMAFETGGVAHKISERSHWTDLVVVKLAHPPPLSFLPRLSSGMRILIRRCISPLLLVTAQPFRLDKVLLAFDGSPKAHEALYVAAYLAGRWGAKLVVLSGKKDERSVQENSRIAQEYLEAHQLLAVYQQSERDPAEAILKTAGKHRVDLIIMGGYGSGLLREVIFGSTVDRVLQKVRQPVLICK